MKARSAIGYPRVTRYKNRWHRKSDPQYGPEFYETLAKPVEHAGCRIYERITGHVWDIVRDGVCLAQYAGLQRAKRAAEAFSRSQAAKR